MRQRGFTLLETLVALAILGLVLAFYGGSLRLMLGAVTRQASTTEAADDWTTTASAVRRLLENLGPGNPPIIEAGPHRLRFMTTLPGIDESVEAVLERDGKDRLMLLWSRAPHVRPLTPPPRPVATELIDGIAGLDFSYWRGSGWTTALPNGQRPDLIRVRLTRRAGRGGADLVVAPRTAPASAP